MAFHTNLPEGWSKSFDISQNNFFSSSSYFSNCKDSFASTNTNFSDVSNNTKASRSSVTLSEENVVDLILNDIVLTSTDPNHFNVHDYGLFMQSTVLPDWWSTTIKQRPVKTPSSANHSSSLWAKVRAVTYMATLAHRAGSWYSDDRTEISPNDDQDDISSISDNEGQDKIGNIQLSDIRLAEKVDLSIPLRRSFSSIDYVKHDDDYASRLSRSRSTTIMNTPDHPPSTPSATNETSILPPPPSSASSSPSVITTTQSTSRVYRFLHCIIL